LAAIVLAEADNVGGAPAGFLPDPATGGPVRLGLSRSPSGLEQPQQAHQGRDESEQRGGRCEDGREAVALLGPFAACRGW
jgi:hypothetical protein